MKFKKHSHILFLFFSFFSFQIFSQCPSGTSPGSNLVTNGDFSAGNTGFVTDYIYCNTSNCLFNLVDSGYSVGSNPSFLHVLFSGSDHTTGTGNLLIVNGGDPTLRAWSQTISVLPNTNYIFSVWVSSMVNFNFAQLKFLINNASIGTITAPSTTGTWIKFSAAWSSGSNTIATIDIRDINNSWNGNDFGLDDISFQQCVCSSPQVIVSANSATICSGQSSTLTASGATSYSWNTGSTANPIIVSPTTSTYYVVIGKDSCGADTVFTSITINQSPNTTITPNNITVTQGQNVTLTASGGGNYSWSNGNSGNSIVISPSSTSAYCVTVSDTNNCFDSACVIVTVKSEECPEIYLPNAFSPNGDNENDILIAQGTKCVKTFSLAIYNRWGEKVFETTDIAKGWDGTYNGKKENSEVFIYYLEAIYTLGTVVKKKGNISLLR